MLTDDQIEAICKRVVDHKMHTDFVANQFDISQRRVQQLAKSYRETGTIPKLEKPGPKPKPPPSPELVDLIIKTKQRLRLGITATAQYLRVKRGLEIGNDTVHDVLLEAGLVVENDNKKGRRRPWVRWERAHSLSTVHMDWYYADNGGKFCCVLDDASRKVLSAGEYDRISAQASVDLLDEAYRAHEHIAPIRECVTDHGGEFWASTRKKDGTADHTFETYLARQGILHIRGKVGRPQTNGKEERIFQTYEQERWDFDTLEDWVDWYNWERPHRSLDWDAMETPGQAFRRKCDDIVLGRFWDAVGTGVLG